MPTITGTANGETINGTSEADIIEGGDGDDIINGLGGNDTITDSSGADTIDGGAGNDTITIDRPYWVTTGEMHISGGDGDDQVVFNVPYETSWIYIDLGAGNDHLLMRSSTTTYTYLTLGSGVDTLELGGSEIGRWQVLDFTPGVGGDVLDIAAYLDEKVADWDPTSNPFGDGTLKLVQVGTQTHLQFDFAGMWVGSSILIFHNTTVAQFKPVNFGGFDPTGFIPGVTLTGTAAGETLTGTGGNDILSGLAGNDTLVGNGGVDTLHGGDNDDRLEGGLGNDVLNGNAGNDRLIDGAGSNSLNGGDGDDTIELVYFGGSIPPSPNNAVYGGTGNDTLLIASVDDCRLTANMGAGNDRITFEARTLTATLTLGLGSDVVALYEYLSVPANPIVITDFATGAGGDRFEFASFAAHQTPEPESVANPFAYGYASLVQDGTSTKLVVSGYTIAIFQNTTVGSFTGDNFDADPLAPAAPGKTLTGTAAGEELRGSPRGDTISGLGGDDIISGGGVLAGDTLSGGDGDDDISGSGAADIIDGGIGADRIVGNGGADQITAGAGNDTIVYSDSLDVIDGGSGNDILDFSGIVPGSGANASMAMDIDLTGYASTGVFKLGGNNVGGVESLFFFMFGTAGNDTVDFDAAVTTGVTFDGGYGNDVFRGTAGVDSFTGGEGNDTLEGRGADDYLEGGYGDDHLIGGAGNDMLQGVDGNDVLEGSQGTDELWGYFGNDSLDGGEGNDLMVGSTGNDVYFVQSLGDVIQELAGEGTDTVRASASYTLAAGLSIEALAADPAAATAAINLTGNELVQTITGNAGANVLDGRGGADTLVGLGGDDWYRVDNAGDVVTEVAGGGTADRVFASVSYVLGASAHVEMLTTNDNSATTAINLTGNALANLVQGNAGANALNGGGGADKLIGLGGDDRYYVDNVGDVITEVAGGGTADRVLAAISYTLGAGVHVELMATVDSTATAAVTLTGNELAQAITGNAGVNVLNGLGGDDVLNGLAGNDTMAGGLGNDTYYVESVGDVVNELAGQGTDTIATGFSYTLAAGSAIENLATIDAVATTAINLTGNAGANAITGNAGANLLDGRGGADVLAGRGGNDVYYVDHASDAVIEAASEGTGDRIFASVSYRLGAGVHVEKLTTTDNAGTAAINLTGNELANMIYGNAGANVLDGKAGADTLIGLGGDDWYYVDHAGDVVSEGAAEGANDRIFASASYTLGANVYVERLTTVDNTATTAINLTGNAFANTIYGNAGANVLDGKAGADAMIGLGGDDTYHVDNALDTVSEGAGGGANDRILASVSYRLGTGVQVERLTTGSDAGTAAIALTGNELANIVEGNAGANTLDGKAGNDSLFGLAGNDTLIGGLGADTLTGGLGDDMYHVDNAGDVVVEAAGQGTADRVFASVSYALGAGVQVEKLTTNDNAGTAAIALSGNELANAIYGNAGANLLDGRAGADTLNGLGGADVFRFATALGAGNVDRIGDFSVADDTIQLDDAVFAGLAAGALAAGAFVTGSAALEADDRILYDGATGALLFDADGLGGAAAVQFATLTAGLALTSADFLVV